MNGTTRSPRSRPSCSGAARLNAGRVNAPHGFSGASASMTERSLKVDEVAELLQVSRWFVYDHGDELGLVKIGGANRYRVDQVEAYIAGRLARAAGSRPPAAPLLSAQARVSRGRTRRVP